MSDTMMEGECPTDAELAAFLDGAVDAAMRERLSKHFLHCELCFELVTEAGMTLQEAQIAPVVRTFPWRRIALAAAAALMVVVSIPMVRAWMHRRSPLGQLQAATEQARPGVGRLAEFEYAPPQDAVRGVTTPRHGVQAAVDRIEKEFANREDSGSLHLLGLAQLSASNTDAAIDTLKRASEAGGEDAIESDLAAAYLARAEKTGSVRDAVEAFECAERVLARRPQFAPALFNRALALEMQQLSPEGAMAAWERYLAVDSTSPWAGEAREHRSRLTSRNSAGEGRALQDAMRSAIHRKAWSELRAFTAQSPPAARSLVEDELLPQQASGSSAEAVGHALQVIGAERAAAGDTSILSVVTLLHSNHTREVAKVVEALARSRVAYRAGRHEEALIAVREARSALTGVPDARALELQLALQEASLLYVRREHAAGAALLHATPEDPRFPSLAGRLSWVKGLIAAGQGHPLEALQAFRSAVRNLERAGEQESAAAARGLLADALDLLGDRETAWDERLYATRDLIRARPGTLRLHIALLDTARAAHDRGSERLAIFLTDLVVRDASQSRDSERMADALEVRGLSKASDGDPLAAERDFAQAWDWTNRIPDARSAERARLAIDLSRVEAAGESAGDREIAASDAALKRAVELDEHVRIPTLHLLRGRMFLRVRRDARAAEAEFRLGLSRIAEQTSGDEDDDQRITHADTAAELSEELIELLASRGRLEEAFALVATARGATLLRSRAGLPRAGTTVPGKAVVLIFEVLRNRTLLWIHTGESRSMLSLPVRRDVLRARLEHFGRHNDDRRAAQDLYELLVAPARVAAGRALTIVPDEDLSSLPFAALQDPRTARYLVEDHSLSIAATTERAESRTATPVRSALVIGDPAFSAAIDSELTPLPNARAEAVTIAGLYPAAVVLTGEAASKDVIGPQLGSFDVVHFAGHGVASRRDPGSSALLLAPGSDDGVLYAREIAAMDLRSVALVVLAGCETAEGHVYSLEGMVGVARAALMAGVREVVATVGTVPDRVSAVLFARLHRELLDGRTAVDALRRTQLAMLRSPDPGLRDPAAWSRVEVLTAAP